jgi:hypothetical protein
MRKKLTIANLEAMDWRELWQLFRETAEGENCEIVDMPDDRWWEAWVVVSATWFYKEAVEFVGWDCIDEELAAELIIDGYCRYSDLCIYLDIRWGSPAERESAKGFTG